MGMIYKRGKTWWITYDRHGKPYRESAKSHKEADAKRLLKKREGEISQGKLPGVYFDKVRFDELAEDFLMDYRINEQDVARAELSVCHLKTMFEGVKVSQITTPKVKAYVKKRLDEGAANATINKELAAMKRMLNLGANQTPPRVNRVMMPHVSKHKDNNTRKGFFEYGDFVALRDKLPDYLKALVTFAYKTGWRKSEITGLKWSQVNLSEGIVRIEPGETKNDEARTIYLDEELSEVLKNEWEARKKTKKLLPYVFPNAEGSGEITDIRKAWARACKQAGIGKRLLHDFRRTAVRNMVRSGVPEAVAMKVSGHKTRSVFDRYNIVNDTDLKLAAQRQEEYLKSQMGTVSGTIANFQNKKEV